MNLNSWNKLPPGIKEIFQQNTGVELSRTGGVTFDNEEKSIVESLIVPYDKEKGNPDIYYLPEAEKARWVQSLKPLHEQWISDNEAKGLPARAFFDDMLETAKKYNK